MVKNPQRVKPWCDDVARSAIKHVCVLTAN